MLQELEELHDELQAALTSDDDERGR